MKQAEELNKDYLSQKIKIPDEYPAKLDDTEGSEEIGEKFSIDEVLGEIKPGPTPVLDRCCRLEPSNYDTEVKYYFLRTDGINKIGRDPIKNTIIILDPSVSEEHIAIYREGKSYFMIVLKKSDKVFTYINGEPLVYLDLVELEHKDKIRVGSVTLTFRTDEIEEMDDANRIKKKEVRKYHE